MIGDLPLILVVSLSGLSALLFALSGRYYVQASKANLRLTEHLSEALEELRPLRMEAAAKRGEAEGIAWARAFLAEIDAEKGQR